MILSLGGGGVLSSNGTNFLLIPSGTGHPDRCLNSELDKSLETLCPTKIFFIFNQALYIRMNVTKLQYLTIFENSMFVLAIRKMKNLGLMLVSYWVCLTKNTITTEIGCIKGKTAIPM